MSNVFLLQAARWILASSGVDGQPVDPPPIAGCVDAKGVSVIWIEDDTLADLAQARFVSAKAGAVGPGAPRRPAVEYNPQRLKRIGERARSFFLAHECGHHVLGHLYGAVQGKDKEQQADCWAIHKLKQDGMLSDEDLESIQHDVGTIARMDKNHSTGLMRAGNLKWCLTDPQPQSTIQPDPPPPEPEPPPKPEPKPRKGKTRK